MKFTEQDYDYLSGKRFSNGYDLKLEGNPVCSRNDKIIGIVKGTACLHIGCCDHIPLIERKIAEGSWLHGLLEENCRYVLGVDISQDAVDFVNKKDLAKRPVYCADVTSPDFCSNIPHQDQRFDYVLLGEILEHVDDPVSFLQRLKANMEQIGFCGTYVITVPNAFCMLRPGKYTNGIECINSDHRFWFTPYTVAKVLVSAGIFPTELWFVNYGSYDIKETYQSDQIIISGLHTQRAENRGCARPDISASICSLETLIGKGKLSEALDLIESLPQQERQQWQIQNLTGVVCAYCGQYQEAETFFSAALEQKSDDINVIYNLADTCTALGKRRKAEELLRRCEQLDSEGLLTEDIALLRQRLAERRGGRVLMAAYYFPPLSGSGVFRSIKFAKCLPLFAWEPTVISTDRPPNGWNFSDDSQLNEIPEGMRVVRIPDGISTGRETTLDSGRVQAILGFLRDILRFSPEADRIFSQLSQSREGITQLLTFPCGALAWAYDVIQYIEKYVDLDQFQVVYTTSGPSSAHLIGFYLKQKYNIPWVADYRDPWILNPYGPDYDPANNEHKLLFELESILLRGADCSLTVEDSLVASYEQRFGLGPGKVVSITNGYDEADFSLVQAPTDRADRFTINYSGLLYTKQRSIDPVLRAVQQLRDEKKLDLSKLRFHIVGASEEGNLETAEKYGLTSIIDHTGYLSHSQALQANLDADLLLLLVGDEPKFKPVYTGKFFEYLRSGRPILALAPKDGVVDRVLRETGHGEAYLSTQIPKIKAMILREYKKWESGGSPKLLHSPKIERFERKVLTQQLANVLSDVVEQRSSLPDTGSVTLVNQGPKYLVICNGGYPREGDPRCMFAHKRVLQYMKAGLDVDAFGFVWGAPLQTYEYQGVHVTQGGAPELQKVLQSQSYAKLLIHFVDSGIMYAIQEAGRLDTPMIIWGHGYEVLRWHRTYYCYSAKEIVENRKELDDIDQQKFSLLQQIFRFPNIHFVFVSNWMANRVGKAVGTLPSNYSIIPNYIDCDYFQLPKKSAEDRTKILCIKSHATKTYAGDLTAKAILELSHRDIFSQLSFDLYGDGVLFEDDFKELIKCNFPNVHVYRKFLSQDEMKAAFEQNGILMAPTRFDTQGVTTCEAMSAGLGVISCNTAAVSEFINEDCGSLYEFDNYFQLADEIEYLYYRPEEFLRKSQNAVKRVREQCGYDATIKKELQLVRQGQ